MALFVRGHWLRVGLIFCALAAMLIVWWLTSHPIPLVAGSYAFDRIMAWLLQQQGGSWVFVLVAMVLAYTIAMAVVAVGIMIAVAGFSALLVSLGIIVKPWFSDFRGR